MPALASTVYVYILLTADFTQWMRRAMAGGIYTWIGRDIFQMEDRRRPYRPHKP